MGILEKKMETTSLGFRVTVPLKWIEYGVIIKYPKPYSVYLRGTIRFP